MKQCLLFAIFAITFVFAQIQDDLGPCDPLVPQNCLLPFPNNFWTTSNSSSATGLNLRFSAESFPRDRRGDEIEPGQWNALDGFSATPAIMSFFADLSLDNVPPHKNIALSLREDCPTILLDTVTLERLPHWGELDETTANTTERAFMMWPIQRLVSGRRYIVAIRNLVSTATGLVIPPSTAFSELLAGSSSDPSVYLRIDHYHTEVFPLLTSIGVDVNSLQLAWDFTIGSTESITGRLIHMRDDGFSRLPASGPVYYITEVNENPYDNVARQIKGSVEVPLYTDKKGPGSHLVLDDGVPVFQGWANTTFTVNIPNSLVTSGDTGMILQYGHGLFGSQDEVNNGNLRGIAEQYGYVTAATDWWGMCAFDVPAVTLMLSENITDVSIIPDRTQQGILNFMILTRMLIAGPFANDPNLLFNGKPVIDTSRVGYNGNSQGGIYGGTFMTVSQDILQGVLGVPGGPYALMLPRSVDFDPYFAILKTRYLNPIDRINLLNIMQLLWDRSDPSGYMSYTTSNTLPNTPAKQIIIQYSLGDSQVTWLSALQMGRSMGCYMFPNNVQEDGEILYGFPIAETEVTTAVIQGFNYDAPNVPQTNTPPPEEYDTHSCCRKDDRAIQSMNTLFTKGVIVDYCNGACNPPNPPIDDDRCQYPPPSTNFIPKLFADYHANL